MPSILVVEQEPRYVERINRALRAEGWSVRVVPEAARPCCGPPPRPRPGSRERRHAGRRGARRSSFSRSAGGPGILAPAARGRRAGPRPAGADDVLAKPFSDPDLVLAARRGLLGRRQAAAAPGGPGPGAQAHLGGHLRRRAGRGRGRWAGPARPAPAPPPRPRSPRRPQGPPLPRPPEDDEMNRKLEQTLSGMLGVEPRPRPAAPAPPQAPRRAPAPARDEHGRGRGRPVEQDPLEPRELGKTKPGVRPARPAPPPPAPAAPPPQAARPDAAPHDAVPVPRRLPPWR